MTSWGEEDPGHVHGEGQGDEGAHHHCPAVPIPHITSTKSILLNKLWVTMQVLVKSFPPAQPLTQPSTSNTNNTTSTNTKVWQILFSPQQPRRQDKYPSLQKYTQT